MDVKKLKNYDNNINLIDRIKYAKILPVFNLDTKHRNKHLTLNEKKMMVKYKYFSTISEVPNKLSYELLDKVKFQQYRSKMRKFCGTFIVASVVVAWYIKNDMFGSNT